MSDNSSINLSWIITPSWHWLWDQTDSGLNRCKNDLRRLRREPCVTNNGLDLIVWAADLWFHLRDTWNVFDRSDTSDEPADCWPAGIDPRYGSPDTLWGIRCRFGLRLPSIAAVQNRAQQTALWQDQRRDGLIVQAEHSEAVPVFFRGLPIFCRSLDIFHWCKLARPVCLLFSSDFFNAMTQQVVDGLESVLGKSRPTSLIRIGINCFAKMVSGELLWASLDDKENSRNLWVKESNP